MENSDKLKTEADQILYDHGLLMMLSTYGTTHISGSYYLNLMTWRDLDIYLEVESIEKFDHFKLGNEINRAFNPVKMSYRNELISQTPGLPAGLYWGIYLGNERKGAWKIDIWVLETVECLRLVDHCKRLNEILTVDNRRNILAIKEDCWRDVEYRRSYGSSDIYTAVVWQNVTNTIEFKMYLNRKVSS